MSDETPVPETLATVADQIGALARSVDDRFAQVDDRFAQVDARFAQVDARFDELKAHLDVKIEAVHEDVKRIYDVLMAQQEHLRRNEREHEAFQKRLDAHDVRILALERKRRS